MFHKGLKAERHVSPSWIESDFDHYMRIIRCLLLCNRRFLIICHIQYATNHEGRLKRVAYLELNKSEKRDDTGLHKEHNEP